jgi:hypothetical protein
VTRPTPKAARLAATLVAALVATTWLGFRAIRAFDQDRHAAEAAAVLSAPDTITHRLPPVPDRLARPQPEAPTPDAGAPEREGGSSDGTRGRLSYRPGTWLTVVDLSGLDPVAGEERYLVFLRNWAGWTLAGAARPGPDGTAQVRSAAEPRPPTIYEVVVTRAVDDATSVPHGQPVLHWFDASNAPPKARQFDFARGA